ncbi:DUF2079 domain-containing protein [Alphaproteobacteria bacterium]|nr:DUF2079 domain-containing protein [Alphaproteobacteria bacterium]
MKIYSFAYHADFAIWTEIINNFKISKFYSSSIEDSFYGNKNYLGSHFVPLVAIFFFFNLIFDFDTFDIIFSNWFLLVTSCYILYLICKELKLSNNDSILISLGFSLYVPFQYLLINPFEMLRFSIPLLFLLILLYIKKKEFLFIICFLLIILIREEVSLYLFFFSIYVFLDKKCNFKLKYFYPVICLISFYLIYFKFMNAFSDGGKIYTGSMKMDISSVYEIAISVLNNFKNQFQSGNLFYKFINIYYFFLPVLFLPLLRIKYLIVILPPFFVGLISNAISHLTIFTYYQSFAYPFIYYFCIREIIKENNHNNYIDKVKILIFSLLTTSILYGPASYSLQFLFDFKVYDFRTFDYSYNNYLPKYNKYNYIENIVEKHISNENLVSAEQHLMPILANNNKKIKTFPDFKDAMFILIDRDYKKKTGIGTVDKSWNGLRENPEYYYSQFYDKYLLIEKKDGIELYIKR